MCVWQSLPAKVSSSLLLFIAQNNVWPFTVASASNTDSCPVPSHLARIEHSLYNLFSTQHKQHHYMPFQLPIYLFLDQCKAPICLRAEYLIITYFLPRNYNLDNNQYVCWSSNQGRQYIQSYHLHGHSQQKY